MKTKIFAVILIAAWLAIAFFAAEQWHKERTISIKLAHTQDELIDAQARLTHPDRDAFRFEKGSGPITIWDYVVQAEKGGICALYLADGQHAQIFARINGDDRFYVPDGNDEFYTTPRQ